MPPVGGGWHSGKGTAMSDAKHTPGPWHWNGGSNVTVGSGAIWIARTAGLASQDGSDSEREPNEARANAALIAAAPELAEGCRMALNHLVAWHTGEFALEKAMLRAALAKAAVRK